MLGENSTPRYHAPMETYLVGGAVRDRLLGLEVRERDWVVVGATVEQMLALGYRQVGRDFPVFLHPETGDEVALARTERKSGPGYRGFVVHASPEVTLEEDLRRRDLTINAMAEAADGTLIDPFGGAEDLRQGRLRHVSPAFVEDPVRALRCARFAARFAHLGFHVSHATQQLMRTMVANGEVDALTPERVWAELAGALETPTPGRFFEVLQRCGALARVLPELKDIPGRFEGRLPVRFALLAWPLQPPEVEAMCDRLRAPNDVRELALLASRNRAALRAAGKADPAALLELLKRADAVRRPERFAELLQAALLADPAVDAARLERALAAAAAVDAGAIAAAAQVDEIAKRIDEARRRAIAAAA